MSDASEDFLVAGLSYGESTSDDSFLREVGAMPAITPPAPEPDRTGQQLGPYTVSYKLGQGGMGLVYLAEDQRLKRTVALKVLPMALVSDDGRRKRFLREARSASAVEHPNVASVFDVGEAEGTVYIAMEHVRGRTLRRVLEDARGPLDIVTVLRMSLDIARGLARAHAVGVVHRDVKPENVMITDDGTVKVLDFGLAKPSGAREPQRGERLDAGDDLASRASKVVGTPGYMSPEQAAGEAVDARTDVYAFGVVLYEMLWGVRPGSGERRRRRPVSTTHALVARVAMKCLRPEQARRFRSAHEVAQRLARIAERRHRRLLARLALTACGVAIGATGAGYMLVARTVVDRAPSALIAGVETDGTRREPAASAAPSVAIIPIPVLATMVSAAPGETSSRAPAPSSSAQQPVP